MWMDDQWLHKERDPSGNVPMKVSLHTRKIHFPFIENFEDAHSQFEDEERWWWWSAGPNSQFHPLVYVFVCMEKKVKVSWGRRNGEDLRVECIELDHITHSGIVVDRHTTIHAVLAGWATWLVLRVVNIMVVLSFFLYLTTHPPGFYNSAVCWKFYSPSFRTIKDMGACTRCWPSRMHWFGVLQYSNVSLHNNKSNLFFYSLSHF